jgi:hypothetical protein
MYDDDTQEKIIYTITHKYIFSHVLYLASFDFSCFSRWSEYFQFFIQFYSTFTTTTTNFIQATMTLIRYLYTDGKDEYIIYKIYMVVN